MSSLTKPSLTRLKPRRPPCSRWWSRASRRHWGLIRFSRTRISPNLADICAFCWALVLCPEWMELEAPSRARGMTVCSLNDGQHRCAFIVQFERKECQYSNSSKSSGEIHILCGCCYAEGVREWRNSLNAGVATPKAFASGEIHILCGCCYAEGVREWRNSLNAGVATPKAFASG